MKAWEDVSEVELRAYLGVRLVMGLTTLDTQYALPAIPQSVKRDRFEDIMRHLHAVNNHRAPSADYRLWKLRTVLDLLSSVRRHLHPSYEDICQ